MTRWARCRCDRSMRLQGMAVRLFAGKAACALDPADDWSQILLMLIETEMTPNPATLKFLPGRQVMESGTRDFATPEEAEVSPLADALFSLGDVQGVFFASDFISVTAGPGVNWSDLKDRKSTRLNSRHYCASRMPSSAYTTYT